MDEVVEQIEDKDKEDVVDIKSSTNNIDDTILISSIMNRYQYSYKKKQKKFIMS